MSISRVLLVDDSALVRNAMQAALEPYGMELGHAENGAVAVARATASRWDLIFLDVVMPVLDGPAALRQIRERGDTTPVVLVTSVSTAAVVASAIKLGGVSYIGKPFTPDQIRAVAGKMLRLDPALLQTPPRVLLQHVDPVLPARLRKLLPAHVAIDPSPTLAGSIDLAEARRYDLVLFESRDLAGERAAIANVLRRAAPAAGIFAITDDAAADAPWQPDEGLDGTVPSSLDDAVVRGFLYPGFLRPLVMLDRAVAHAAGFRGQPAHLPAYIAMLGRVLVDRCTRIDQTADLQIDLTRMPDDAGVVAAVVDAANRELRQAGAAPAFRLAATVQAVVRERLPQLVVL
jgi:CheY-like chemotaxis protein